MDLRIFTEPHQGATYDQVLAAARTTEACGYDGFFRSDHYLRMTPGDAPPGLTDAWVTLAGLALQTRRVRLGTLVSPATFRLPSVLAISVAQVDAMSGGRVELGLGTGWFEAEHSAYGIPFPEVKERFDVFEEQLAVVTGLWSTPAGQTFSFSGEHYTLADAPALPAPLQPRIPLIVGGGGPRRTPALAARFATEFNTGFDTPDVVAQRFDRVRAACREIGRDPAELTYSVALNTVVGRDDAEVAARADAVGAPLEGVRPKGLVGTPEQVVDRIGAYAAVGATRVYLQMWDLADLDHIELVAAEVMPRLPQPPA
jgi:F420-dependent oxidoreductase-like protein